LESKLPTYIKRTSDNAIIAKLAINEWKLPNQINALETWLQENKNVIVPGTYIADIGFSIRENANGGGAVLCVESMSIMSQLGIQLYLSEYRDD
jgi:hypothetical protein